MRRYSTLLAMILALGWATGARAADVSVAVLGIEPIDVPEPLAQQLTDALRQRATSTAGVHTVPGKDLIEVKMVFGCDGELPACMAQAGKTLGADKLLYGTLKKGPSKTTVTVTLKLLDVKTAVVEKFLDKTVQKRELAGGSVSAAAGNWFAQLLEIEAKPVLTVTSDPSGASVSVDGQGYGRTPLTLRDLSAGAHTVVLSMSGRQTATRTVDLRAGGSHDVVVTLEPEAPPVVAHKEPAHVEQPETPPPYVPPSRPQPATAEHPGRTAKIVAGVLVGTAVLSAVAAIVTWHYYDSTIADQTKNDLAAVVGSDGCPMSGMPMNEVQAFACAPGPNPPASLGDTAQVRQYKKDYQNGVTVAQTTTALWVVTGALAAGGVVSFVIGDRQAAKAKERKVGFRESLRLAPVFSTQGGGLTAKFEF